MSKFLVWQHGGMFPGDPSVKYELAEEEEIVNAQRNNTMIYLAIGINDENDLVCFSNQFSSKESDIPTLRKRAAEALQKRESSIDIDLCRILIVRNGISGPEVIDDN